MKRIFNSWFEKGIMFPYAYDPVEHHPSITLFFPYVLFVLLVGSLIALHFRPMYFLPATLMTAMVWSISVIFYRLRKLDKVKIDLKNQSLDLSDDEDTKGS